MYINEAVSLTISFVFCQDFMELNIFMDRHKIDQNKYLTTVSKLIFEEKRFKRFKLSTNNGSKSHNVFNLIITKKP